MSKLHRIKGRDPPVKVTPPPPSRHDILNEMDLFGRSPADCPVSYQPDSWDDNTLVIEDTQTKRTSSLERLDDLDSVSLSSSYSGEWDRLFTGVDFMRKLCCYGLRGKLRSSRFRSICWKLYLEVLPEDPSVWVQRTKEWRERYAALKEKLVVNPRTMEAASDLSVNNPLSQEVQSPWNQFFQDNQLRVTIRQDVIRTFPDVEFFSDDKLQELMCNVLFCFAKQNTMVSYRQGMHELLAPLIFVLHCDHQAFLHACETDAFGQIVAEHRDVVKELLDPAYIEHDTFAMLCQIMLSVEPWYVSREVSPPPCSKAQECFNSEPFVHPPEERSSNVIVSKLLYIQERLLKRFDRTLYDRLHDLEIEPQIYGIRWLRLLFGRELPMQDLLVLWDAIFADGVHFDLVDYIFVSMLMFLHEALLNLDYPSCLHLLMRYPPVGDVHYFIQQALYLRDPNHQPRPSSCLYHRVNIHSPKVNYMAERFGNAGGINLAEKAATMMTTGLTSLTKRLQGSNGDGGQHRSTPSGGMAKSSSEPMTLATENESLDSPLSTNLDRPRTSSASNVSKLERPMKSLQVQLPRELLSWPPGSPNHASETMDSSDVRVQHQVAVLSRQVAHLERMCELCAGKMSTHLAEVQEEVMRAGASTSGNILLALAELKQVKDVLRGTLHIEDVFPGDNDGGGGGGGGGGDNSSASIPDAILIRDDHYGAPNAASCSDEPARFSPIGNSPADLTTTPRNGLDCMYDRRDQLSTKTTRNNLDGLPTRGAASQFQTFPAR